MRHAFLTALIRQCQLLSCALVSAVFFGLGLVRLFYLLNDDANWNAISAAGLAASILWPYALAPLLMTFAGFHLVQFLAGRTLSLWWFSVPVLAWSFAADGLLLVSLVIRNAILHQAFLSRGQINAFVWDIVALIAFICGMVLMGSYNHFFPKMRWGRAGVILGLAACSALATPFLLSPGAPGGRAREASFGHAAEHASARRSIVIMGIEGGSLNYMLPLISQGRLPNFQKVIEDGAGGRLRTLVPAQSLPLWATVLTGRPPSVHGVTGEQQYTIGAGDLTFYVLPRGLFFQSVLERTGALRTTPLDRLRRRSVCYWDFFQRQSETRVAAIDIWAPVPELNGVIAYGLAKPDEARFVPSGIAALYPAVAAEAAQSSGSRLEAMTGAVPVPAGSEWRRDLLLGALEGDERVRLFTAAHQADILAFRLEGLDTVSHYFPASFAGDLYKSLDESEPMFERTVELYYQYYDDILGGIIDNLPADTLVCVVSVHGIEPLPTWRRMFELIVDKPAPVGGHESGPDGFVYFYGRDVSGSVTTDDATLYDILPTILYYQGIPIGLDMPGKILLDVFRRSFKETHPASYVPSHDAAG